MPAGLFEPDVSRETSMLSHISSGEQKRAAVPQGTGDWSVFWTERGVSEKENKTRIGSRSAKKDEILGTASVLISSSHSQVVPINCFSYKGYQLGIDLNVNSR